MVAKGRLMTVSIKKINFFIPLGFTGSYYPHYLTTKIMKGFTMKWRFSPNNSRDFPINTYVVIQFTIYKNVIKNCATKQ